MKFKTGRYYCVINRDFNAVHPAKCLIRVGTYDNKISGRVSWDIEVIKVFKIEHDTRVREGLLTYWFEEWCEVLKEYKHYPNESEILAFAL